MQKVSVIITTHNRKDTLIQAVKSVLKQTYENIECIVVDDASDDEYTDWLIKLEDKRIKKIFISKKDTKGGNYARNIGIEASTGEYIAFLDDDDIWLPTKIEKQVEILNNNKEVGLVYCGRIIYIDEKFAFSQEPIEEYSGDLRDKVFEKIFCTTSSIMIRRDVIKTCGNFDVNLKFWQEYDFLIRVCDKYKVMYASESLFIFRNNFQDKNRLSNKYEEWKKSVDYIYTKYYERISKLSYDIKKNMKQVYYENAISRCYKNGNEKDKRSLLKEMYRLKPCISNYLKWIFNLSPQQIIYIKYHLNRFKLVDVESIIKEVEREN